MANHKNAAPTWLNSEYLQNVLRNFKTSHDLHVSKVNITPGSVDGDNFACQIFRILVDYNENNIEKQISLIGKYKVKTKLIEKMEAVFDAFTVEAHFFNDMPPLFKKVLNKTELEFLPQCLYLDLDNNLILMEDLVILNYKLQPKGTFLNKKQCVLVMESLAEMHGASYKALKIEPSLRNKYSNSLINVKTDGPFAKLIGNSLKGITKCIKLYGLPKNLEEELLKLKEKLDANWFTVCDLKEDHLNFLLHGDCWMNNIMFHTSGDKIKLLDFQIYNYNCFANDLHYFLFISASSEVIVNDIDFLLETYYEKLRSVAPDIPNLTLERVQKEFAECYFFGYAMTMTFRPAICANPPPDIEKIMNGIESPMGFDAETFVADLPILMEFFKKVGAF